MTNIIDEQILRDQSLIDCLLKKALQDESNDTPTDSDNPSENDNEYTDIEYDIGHNPDVSYVAIAYNSGDIIKYEGNNAPKARIGDKEYIENWATNVTYEDGGWTALYVKGGTYYIIYGDTEGVYWTKNPAGQIIDGRWTDEFQPIHPKKSLSDYNDTVNNYIEKNSENNLVPNTGTLGCGK